ncbi:DUF4296 domain-containing protein [Flavihumibacter sp. CACIAM 22H1]|uniref:DUF4296 domain-containing protein n=1 Tax=Flavihumibacter sp. CACIAM 22H1 TaxID=1812911 RepID=UPI0007A8C295|nr:DUF4296 domain-containing protein [Flavihumibacter sp. CACIAM 22H1]KYP14687.1 MAG: hypothetical protein A1D16_09820 [Flavihumibacter sp. CACIAM 22H1]
MKKRLIVLGAACLVLLACSDEGGNEAPLTQKKMVPLVYQLMLVDEISLDYKSRDSSFRVDSIRGKKYDQVFALNKVDYKTFKESYEYYLARPNQLKAIFDSVEAFANRDRIERMNPSSKPGSDQGKQKKNNKPV